MIGSSAGGLFLAVMPSFSIISLQWRCGGLAAPTIINPWRTALCAKRAGPFATGLDFLERLRPSKPLAGIILIQPPKAPLRQQRRAHECQPGDDAERQPREIAGRSA